MIRPLCIYHDNCADGFTSAWIVHKALRGEVDFLPAQYGKPLPAPDLVHNRDLIIVDFSYSGEQLDILAGASALGLCVIVITHLNASMSVLGRRAEERVRCVIRMTAETRERDADAAGVVRVPDPATVPVVML